MGMSVAIPGSVESTQTTPPGAIPFMALAISTIGYGQSRPEVSRVRSGTGREEAGIAAPFIATGGRGQEHQAFLAQRRGRR